MEVLLYLREQTLGTKNPYRVEVLWNIKEYILETSLSVMILVGKDSCREEIL
jgi:hypothetical protein